MIQRLGKYAVTLLSATLISSCWAGPEKFTREQSSTLVEFTSKTARVGSEKGKLKANYTYLNRRATSLESNLSNISLPPPQTDLVKIFLLSCLNATSEASTKSSISKLFPDVGCHPVMMNAFIELLPRLSNYESRHIRESLRITSEIQQEKKAFRLARNEILRLLQQYRVFLSNERTKLRQYRRQKIPSWSVLTKTKADSLKGWAKVHRKLIGILDRELSELDKLSDKTSQKTDELLIRTYQRIIRLRPKYDQF